MFKKRKNTVDAMAVGNMVIEVLSIVTAITTSAIQTNRIIKEVRKHKR